MHNLLLILTFLLFAYSPFFLNLVVLVCLFSLIESKFVSGVFIHLQGMIYFLRFFFFRYPGEGRTQG